MMVLQRMHPHGSRLPVSDAAGVQFAVIAGADTYMGCLRRQLLVAVVLIGAAGAVHAAANAGSGPQAGELKVFTTRAIATVLERIRGDIELRTGRKLVVTSDVAIRLVRRIEAGEPFDFLVAAPDHVDQLVAANRIVRETRTDLARSGIGVAVREGAPKPDVSSVPAFVRALREARSIAYLKEGQSGIYIAGVLDRLGIADEIKGKVTRPETDIVSQLVSRGDIELGIVVITQILTTDGVALAGPLPAEIQSYITFSGGISADSRARAAANELLRLLQGPAAIAVMRSQGMEPGIGRR